MRYLVYLSSFALGLVLLTSDSRAQTPTGLDSSFGTGGKLQLAVPGYSVEGVSCALTGDGKLVLVGTAVNTAETPTHRFVVARLNGDGSLDTSFASTGIKVFVSARLGASHLQPSYARAVTVSRSGSILIAGESGNKVFVAEINADGSEGPGVGGIQTVLGSTNGVGVQVRLSAIKEAASGRVWMLGRSNVYPHSNSLHTGPISALDHSMTVALGASQSDSVSHVYYAPSFGSGLPEVRRLGPLVLDSLGRDIFIGSQRWDSYWTGASFDRQGSYDDRDFDVWGLEGTMVDAVVPAVRSPEFPELALQAWGQQFRVVPSDSSSASMSGKWLPGSSAQQEVSPLALHRRADELVIVGASTRSSDSSKRGMTAFLLGRQGELSDGWSPSGSVSAEVGTFSTEATAMAVRSDTSVLLAGTAKETAEVPASFAVVAYSLPPLAEGRTVISLNLPERKDVDYGQDAVFEINATSTETLSYQWYRNGSPIPGQTGSKLVLSNPNVSYANWGRPHDGMPVFHVAVYAPAGTVVSAQCALYVWPKITFIAKSPQLAPVGATRSNGAWYRSIDAIWDVSPGGALYSPSWMGGSWGNPSTETDFIVGAYVQDIFGMNPAGVYREVRIVAAKSDPAALAPAARLFAVGQETKLELDDWTTTAEPLTMQWQKNGYNLAGATEGATTVGFAPVSLATAGAYRVVLRNPARAVISPTIQVGVVDTLAQRQVPAAAGKAATLTAPATGSGLTYQWRRDGVNLVESKRIVGTKARVLSIKTVEAADVGDYTCVVSNSDRSLTTGAIPLVLVTAAPAIPIAPLAAGLIRMPYQYDLGATATVKASSFKISGLPAGLTYDASTGVIYGTPAVSGAFMITVVASNAFGTAPALKLQLAISPLPSSLLGTHVGVLGGARADLSVAANGVCSIRVIKSWLKYPRTVHSLVGMLTRTEGDVFTLQGATVVPSYSGAVRGTLSLSAFPGSVTVDLNFLDGSGAGIATDNIPMIQQTWHAVLNPAKAYAGYYTAPGYVLCSATATGTAVVTARLADGAAYAGSTIIGPTGRMPCALYQSSGLGYVMGILSIQPGTVAGAYDTAFTGDLAGWSPIAHGLSPQGISAEMIRDGAIFGFGTEVKGSRYLPPNVSLVSGSLMMNRPDEDNNLWAYIKDWEAGEIGQEGRISTRHFATFGPRAEGSSVLFGPIWFTPSNGLFSGTATLFVPNFTADGTPLPERRIGVAFTGVVSRFPASEARGTGSGHFGRAVRLELTDPNTGVTTRPVVRTVGTVNF